MTRNQLFALAYEVERTLYESSSSWEGIDAQEIPLSEGEVVLRIQPGFAAAMPLRFHPATVEISLAHAIEQVEALLHRCLWVIGPSSQLSDLQQRFIALGFTVRMELEGLTGKNRLRRVMHTYGIAARRLPQEVCLPWQSNRDCAQ